MSPVRSDTRSPSPVRSDTSSPSPVRSYTRSPCPDKNDAEVFLDEYWRSLGLLEPKLKIELYSDLFFNILRLKIRCYRRKETYYHRLRGLISDNEKTPTFYRTYVIIDCILRDLDKLSVYNNLTNNLKFQAMVDFVIQKKTPKYDKLGRVNKDDIKVVQLALLELLEGIGAGKKAVYCVVKAKIFDKLATWYRLNHFHDKEREAMDKVLISLEASRILLPDSEEIIEECFGKGGIDHYTAKHYRCDTFLDIVKKSFEDYAGSDKNELINKAQSLAENCKVSASASIFGCG